MLALYISPFAPNRSCPLVSVCTIQRSVRNEVHFYSSSGQFERCPNPSSCLMESLLCDVLFTNYFLSKVTLSHVLLPRGQGDMKKIILNSPGQRHVCCGDWYVETYRAWRIFLRLRAYVHLRKYSRGFHLRSYWQNIQLLYGFITKEKKGEKL